MRIGLLAPLLLLACSRQPAPPSAPTGAGPQAAAGLPVRTLSVTPQPMEETITATGTLRADESAEVRAEIAGKITHIHFQEGTAVRAGAPLISINDAELRASLQRALHRRDLADLKARRLATLRTQGGVTQQDYDIAVSEFNVLVAEAALIEAQLDKTEIRAPFDGVVGLRAVSEGAYVTPATHIATFQRLDQLKVDFSVPEKYAGVLRLDSAVTITVAGGQTLTGKIHAIEPSVDAATRTVQVRAVCSNPSGRLFSGGFVSVRLNLNDIPDAILVPSLALVPGAADQSVFVLENGKASRRVVRTGTRTDTAVQIVEGLHPGDQLIVSNLQQLRPGLEVRMTNGDGHPASTAAGPAGRKGEPAKPATALN